MDYKTILRKYEKNIVRPDMLKELLMHVMLSMERQEQKHRCAGIREAGYDRRC